VSANSEFNQGDTFYWSVTQDQLINAMQSVEANTISGRTLETWQSEVGVDIYSYNLDGTKNIELLNVASGGRLGIKDNTREQLQEPNQLGYRGETSETMIFDFQRPIGEATVSVANLIAGEGEVGSVSAYLNGEKVGDWTFSGVNGATLNGTPVDFTPGNGYSNSTFTLEGVIFDQLRFTATPYADGINGQVPTDSSDYYLTSIKYKEVPQSGFQYKVTDDAGNDSSVVDVTIGKPATVSEIPEGYVAPYYTDHNMDIDAIVAGVAAHTSGNGDTGTYANNGKGGKLQTKAMEGSASTLGATKDSDGFYGVDHNSNGENDNPDMIDGNEALLIKFSQPIEEMTFAIKGDLDGANYSLFDSNESRIGEPTQVIASNGRIEIASNNAFTYIAFDGNSSGNSSSSFAVKPIGYIAESGDQFIQGTSDADSLYGGDGDDILVGGSGDDTLIGGEGKDIFLWNDDDQGTSGTPAIDTVEDFGNGSDTIDISDLLQDESKETIGQYIFAEEDVAGNVVLNISAQGNTSEPDQKIALEGNSFSDFGVNNEEDLIAKLIADGQLKIDQ
jgi:Ca2+-binding RTX toxin-like protein